MPNSIISEGKTTNEAIENGLKKLNATKNQVNIKVLESEDKRSFFSILAPRVVKVEITLKEEKEEQNEKRESSNVKKEPKVYTKKELESAKRNADAFLTDFIKAIGNDVEYEISENQNGLEVNIKGESASFLIGYRGETLYAVQNILSSVASKGLDTRMRVILDIAGYKQKREKTLEELAEKVARTVAKTGKPVTLEPMKAYERKIIHSKLQNSNKVTTKSIGEEPKRRLVISPK